VHLNLPCLRAALIASRVGKDLRGNLAAVRDHAEELGQSAVALPQAPAAPRALSAGTPVPRLLRSGSPP
jgi:hypothetical protein